MKVLVSRISSVIILIFITNLLILYLTAENGRKPRLHKIIVSIEDFIHFNKLFIYNLTSFRQQVEYIHIRGKNQSTARQFEIQEVADESKHSSEYSKQKCRIPELNPFNKDVLPFLTDESRIPECRMKRYGKVENGFLHLKVKKLQKASLYYIHRVDDFDYRLSKAYPLLSEANDKTDEQCWSSCGNRAGNCTSFCGSGGYCCRKGWTDCPAEAQKLATNDYHSCVYVDTTVRPATFGIVCWEECNNTGGSCPWRCGEGGYCCRDGFEGCPDHVVDTGLNHHACTYVDNTTSNNPQRDVDIKYPLKEDFIKLKLTVNNEAHQEYHAAFSSLAHTPKPPTQKTDDKKMNILMIMFDSVSNANLQRALKKSYKYLKDDANTFIFKGQSIVGDGTTAQLCAMLTGVPEHDLPEARKGISGSEPVDRYPFIFNKLHRHGYKTLYSEDDPWVSTWQYRLNGFKDPPTTKYLRPFWQAIDGKLHKESPACSHQIAFEYLKRFFKTYQNDKKFAVVINSYLSHNALGAVAIADDDIVDLFTFLKRSRYLQDTVVFLFGDHGLRAGSFRSTLQGKMEERLPFMSITVPPRFHYHSAIMKHVKDNVNLMTSHFDIYATLQHLLDWPHYNNETKRKYGRSLFSDIKSLNRTCDQAGVEDHWCTCTELEKVNVASDPTILKVVNTTLKYINDLNEKDAKGKCAELKLGKVIRAGRRIPNLKVRQFSSSRRDSRCDSCGTNYDEKAKLLRYTYEISFSVSPSGGEYEVTRECEFKDDGSLHINDSKDISRTNLYANQPHCVAKELPHLRKYCFCKNNS